MFKRSADLSKPVSQSASGPSAEWEVSMDGTRSDTSPRAGQQPVKRVQGALRRFFFHLGGIGSAGQKRSGSSGACLNERSLMQPPLHGSSQPGSSRSVENESATPARGENEAVQSVLSAEWPVVSIRWVDAEARGGPGWEDPEDMVDFALKPLMEVHSVGLMIHSCDQYVALTDSRGPDQIGGVQKIPRAWINSMDLMVPSNELPPPSLPLDGVRTG